MKISVDDIKNAKNNALQINFEDTIEGIETEGAVSAQIVFSSFGACINAKGKIVANVKLKCDRCLKDFIEKIDEEIDETYALGHLTDKHSHEIELKEGDFVTDLNGESEIDVNDLIYQSLILNIPNPSVCDINCKGSVELEKYMKKDSIDPRLEIFKNMKINEEK